MKALLMLLTALALAVSAGAVVPAGADEKAAIKGCRKQLKTVGGPDARAGIKVLSSEYSEAGTLVMLRDAGGTVWRCIGYNDGAVGDLGVAQAADDGGGAMAGAPAGQGAGQGAGASAGEPTTATEHVRFAAGASAAQMNGGLTPGSSVRYVLGAQNGQFLDVRVMPQGPGISYQIFNPDGTFLLDQVDAGLPYRGQLWQSGDHVVEVINRGTANTSYTVAFSIE